MASAWVRAPARFPHSPIEEDSEGLADPNTTFSPQLLSNPELRERVRSSSYGTVLPKVEKVVLEENDLRPWQEQPTFAPSMPTCELRSKAQSSKYGLEAVSLPQPAAPEVPSFTPELITKNSKVSQQWHGKSANYGRVTATNTPRKEPPRPSFTPEFPNNKQREKLQSSVSSSRYGAVSPTPAQRPKSAPAIRDRASELYTPKNIHDQDDVFAERAKGSGFVLDCVSVSGMMSRTHKYPGVAPREGLFVSSDAARTSRSQQMQAAARSSQYGVKSPARAERPSPLKKEQRLSFGGSAWNSELPPTPRSAMYDQVRSKGYGKQSPPVIERPARPTSEPRWNDSRSVKTPELGPVPRSKLNDKVRSHQYGIASPEKLHRAPSVLSPVWVPSSTKGSIPEPEPLSPERRSKAYDQIRGHYGNEYTPFSASESFAHEAY